MILDNLVTNTLTKELIRYIKGGKIERIAQLSKDCFILHVWNKKLYKIVISLNAQTYRICFTDKNYKLNNQGSTFFNHLKKSIESGTIVDIEQINFDRIISLKVESFDNVKDKVTFNLIIELTGNYSNMILLDQQQIIIGCHNLVDETQSEERNVLLGERYVAITNKENKLDLAELDYQKFSQLIDQNNMSLKNFLIKKLLGISSHTATLLLKKVDIENTDSNQYKEKLFEVLKDFDNKFKSNNLNLEFYITKENNRIKDIDFDFSNQGNQDISVYIDKYYDDKETNNNYKNLENYLKKKIEKALLKLNEKKKHYEDHILNAESFEIFKQYGEIIYSNLHNLPETAQFVDLENYYDENKLIRIELNENKTVSENAQSFFKKYNKLKTGIDFSEKMLEEVNKEIDYLEESSLFIENAETIEDLKEIEEELIQEKYINKYAKASLKKKKIEKVNLINDKTSSGLEILIGKNNNQNDFLTTKLAANSDIWLHTRLIPGSHVVIRTENGQKKVSEQDIIEAAVLAARYSKAKFSSNVCVIYTKIKNVKKPAKAKPGLVIYSNEKAIYVNP